MGNEIGERKRKRQRKRDWGIVMGEMGEQGGKEWRKMETHL